MSRSREKLVTDKRTNERTKERADTGQFKGHPEVGQKKKKSDTFMDIVSSWVSPPRNFFRPAPFKIFPQWGEKTRPT